MTFCGRRNYLLRRNKYNPFIGQRQLQRRGSIFQTRQVIDGIRCAQTIARIQTFVNMAAEPTPSPSDFTSVYTVCCRIGCKKEVKRGTVCECGMQN
ncbi:hypothetical protein N7465_011660 [Penicillium sp. CMV-2018d]|nr:hypothetical protein N7465_011660 [Penicillium sp. CMV-2018d]